MDGVLGQEEDYGEDYEGEQAENEEASEGANGEELIRLMLNIGDHLHTAELALFFHRSKQAGDMSTLRQTKLTQCRNAHLYLT
jgi:hypothetical protein